MDKEKILNKAKGNIYKHRAWFAKRDKTVYEAMKYLADNPDFYIDLKNTINHISQIEGYNGDTNRDEIINYCIKNFNKHWRKLRIKFRGSEGGTDKGKLKLQTYLILSENEIYLNNN